MAGVPAGLPAGVRLSDHISLGVIARAFPPDRVGRILAETGRASERDLPAQVMVYYAIALALYMGSSTREVLRGLLEGLRWLWGAAAVKVAGKSGISQARSRLGGWKHGFQPAARVVRAGGRADCDARQQRGVVPGVAAGQPGRLLPGCRRYRGEPRCLRLSGSKPR
jgi:Insertion element 4 transposase N-terminal